MPALRRHCERSEAISAKQASVARDCFVARKSSLLDLRLILADLG
jgi:hypothetical protein